MVEAFIGAHADLSDDGGRRRVVWHGYLPERSVQTGIGPVAVRRPRVRDGRFVRTRFVAAYGYETPPTEISWTRTPTRLQP